MAHVFISYSRTGADIEGLAKYLDERGLDAWWNEARSGNGTKYDEGLRAQRPFCRNWNHVGWVAHADQLATGPVRFK